MEVRVQTELDGQGGARSPLVFGNGAIFTYQSDTAQSVSFAADSTGWRPLPMERQSRSGTDGGTWVLQRSYPADARDEYLFFADGQAVLDPLNPLRGVSPFGPHSECYLPKYHPPRPIEPPRDGRVEQRVLAGRTVDLYLPAQLDGASLLVVQDGSDYMAYTGMPGLIDALIRERAIVPTLAVFITPQDRTGEYRMNDRYVDWLADELLPELSKEFPISARPEDHGLIGASLGGLIATYGALRRPDAFRLIGAQSPAYRLWPSLRTQLEAIPPSDRATFWLHADAGSFEMMLHGREFVPPIRRAVADLRRKGYPVQYDEVNEGHNWTTWRGRLPRLLTWLLAAR